MSTMPVDLKQVLAKDNVELPQGAGNMVSLVCMGLGALAIVGIFLMGFRGDQTTAEVALHSYHVGFLVALGFSLGAMIFTMIFHQTNAGWTATCRRQFENVMSLVWVAGVLFIIDVLFQLVLSGRSSAPAYLWDWMDSAHVAGDPIYEAKSKFLNVPFFFIRAIIYFGAWMGLSYFLYSFSTRQDTEGDRWLTAHARKLSAPGILIFAFTAAFAGFDWIMALDYHWFSTMLGVYFFAGCAVSSLALVTLVLIVLRSVGRLHGAFTDEHLHDLGKLVFAFTVFWAYISFSQYFLIWFANIPEETAWFLMRKEGPWEIVSYILPISHFIIPFIFLMARTVRRSRLAMAIGCIWLIGAHILDWYWAVRPEVTSAAGPVGPRFMDLVGIAGPVLIFTGMLIRKVASAPLIPLKDPRLPEGLGHKNYV